jgi:pyruvate dehydrogenase E2 component (dihydrolipoamide acetyltransferase)
MKGEIFIPHMGPNIDFVIVGKIYKEKGEEVKKGDVIFDIATSKSVFSVEAEKDGTIDRLDVKQGDEKKVLDVVGNIR